MGQCLEHRAHVGARRFARLMGQKLRVRIKRQPSIERDLLGDVGGPAKLDEAITERLAGAAGLQQDRDPGRLVHGKTARIPARAGLVGLRQIGAREGKIVLAKFPRYQTQGEVQFTVRRVGGEGGDLLVEPKPGGLGQLACQPGLQEVQGDRHIMSPGKGS